MAVQYLYPILNNNINQFIGQSNWSGIPTSNSGLYSYINEGVSTANDINYIKGYGGFSLIPTNDYNWQGLYLTLDNMQVYPSSLQLNIRTTWNSPPITQTNISGIKVYVFGSGYRPSGDPYETYGNQLFRQVDCGNSTYYLLNQQNVLASALVYSIASGTSYNNYTINLDINNSQLNNILDYNSATYIYLGFGSASEEISAVELVASGNYITPKNLNLNIPGGNRYDLRREVLGIYHDFGTQISVLGDVPYGLKWVEAGDDSILTGCNSYDDSVNANPQMCLWSGGFNRQDIFRDCFIELNKPSGYYSVEDVYLDGIGWLYNQNINHVSYSSIISNHSLIVTAPSPYDNPMNYTYVGKSSRNTQGPLEDSSISWDDALSGNIQNVLPSGDFTLWLGLSSDSLSIPLIHDEYNDFRFGTIAGVGGSVYAKLKDSTSVDYTVIGYTNNGPLGYIVTYNSGGLSLYHMKNTGAITKLGQTDPFTRISYTKPSGTLIISPTPVDVGIANIIYEFGAINSGISSYDLSRMNREQLFPSLDYNLYGSQPITSGMINLKFNQYQDRRSTTGYSGFVLQPYNVGNCTVNVPENSNLYGSTFDPYYNDRDLSRIVISGYLTNSTSSYSDIAFNCHISGQAAGYNQDGDVYFSGWIDASTNNPSGFLSNNMYVRLFQDRSMLLNGNYSRIVQSGFCSNGGYYTTFNSLFLARGKIAANTFTLRSGLNEYIVRLKEEMYYYDQYFNIISGVTNLTGSQIQHYDKQSVGHLDWNAADVSLFYIGRDDINASGYVDNLNIYTAKILSDNWGSPPTGIYNNLDLYTNGLGTYTSGIDLYLQQSEQYNNLDLSIFNGTVTIYSGAAPVELTVYDGPTIKNNFLDLYINGPVPVNSGINLYTIGPVPYSSSLPLYLFSPPPPSSFNSLQLFTHSSTNSSVIGGINLVMISGMTNINNNVPLYLNTQLNDLNYGVIPLYLRNDTTIGQSLNLVVAQNASSLFSSQKLFVAGYGVNDGASIKTNNIPLYMGTGNESWYNSIALSIKVPESNPSGVDLITIGGTYVNNSINLSIPSSVGPFNNSMTLYSHGF